MINFEKERGQDVVSADTLKMGETGIITSGALAGVPVIVSMVWVGGCGTKTKQVLVFLATVDSHKAGDSLDNLDRVFVQRCDFNLQTASQYKGA